MTIMIILITGLIYLYPDFMAYLLLKFACVVFFSIKRNYFNRIRLLDLPVWLDIIIGLIVGRG